MDAFMAMRRRTPRALRPGAEPLDRRDLPAAAVFAGGVLTVVGTEDADLIQVRQASGSLFVLNTPIVSGSRVLPSVPAASVRQVVVHGLGGNDVLDLNSGSGPAQQPLRVPTRADGGEGNDSVLGGFGRDTLLGGPGDDVLNGLAGADDLLGGERTDLLAGGDGNDRLDGGAGGDALFGENGNDTIQGGDGDDTLLGGPGNDQLRDNPGDDALYGAAGNDTLASGLGNDSLWGGAGRDVLNGGPGTNLVDQDGTPPGARPAAIGPAIPPPRRARR
jgi:Ca2+-binding RTX toxin-like protein